MFTRPVSWKTSLRAAVIAVYAPFVLMTLYTLAFVACSHCKQAVVSLLPGGPGLVGTLLVLNWTDVGRLPDAIELTIACFATAAFVMMIASLGRLGVAWFVGGAVAAIAISSVNAFFLLALIRM